MTGARARCSENKTKLRGSVNAVFFSADADVDADALSSSSFSPDVFFVIVFRCSLGFLKMQYHIFPFIAFLFNNIL